MKKYSTSLTISEMQNYIKVLNHPTQDSATKKTNYNKC